MVSAVHPALQDSEQRLRAGKATPTERNLLTRIAVAQDVRAQAEERATTKSDEPAPSVAADDASAIAARDPGLLEKTNAQITQAASTSQNGTSSAEIRTPSVRVAGAGTVAAPRIYIQIYEESKRAAAEKLRDWTQNTKNWLAPGVENVSTTATMRGTKVPLGSDHYRVVFFNNTAKPRAEEIADWLQKNTSAPVDVKKSALPAPTGQIEVWYPKH